MGPNAVETAGDFVPRAAELGPGVEGGHGRFHAGDPGGGVDVDGNPASVVLHRDGGVFADGDDDLIAEAGHRLVDGVVDDLVHQMMETGLVGAADVHAGTAANGLSAFEDLDVLGGVALVC